MTPPKNETERELLELVTGTYDEVLDATKHQDDKIGRLFTGISFLTAAALALANVGGSAFLKQGYRGWTGPPLAVMFLSVFLLLVVVSVMLLINSLATPLRTPGLSRKPPKPHIDWANEIEASPLYFGEISRLRLVEWERKWASSPDTLRKERRQSLIGETHNLAARTQFKYARTSEAISICNLALLSLSCTIVLVLTAATVQSPPQASEATLTLPIFPQWPRVVLALVVAIFYFIHLQGSVRYTRQTLDEIQGSENVRGARWRYIWVGCASVWAFLVACGSFRGWPGTVLVILVGLCAISALYRGTYLQRKQQESILKEAAAAAGGDPNAPATKRVPRGTWFALILGGALTLVNGLNIGPMRAYGWPFGAALIGAVAITVLTLMAPTMAQNRNRTRYESDPKRKALVAELESSAGNSAGN